jgi:hypothetical protein
MGQSATGQLARLPFPFEVFARCGFCERLFHVFEAVAYG